MPILVCGQLCGARLTEYDAASGGHGPELHGSALLADRAGGLERVVERRRFWSWAVIVLLLAVPQTVLAKKISLAWDASSSGKVAGYRIYYSRVPGLYEKSHSVKVGKATRCTLDLPPGPWYLVVAAYDAKGHESDYSNPVCWQCPSKSVPAKAATRPGGAAAPPRSRSRAVSTAAVSSRPLPIKRNRPLHLLPRRDDHAPGTLIPPSVDYKNIK